MAMVGDEHQLPGLYMLWPGHLLGKPPPAEVPAGYMMRVWADGNESAVQALLALDGGALSAPQWQAYQDRLLPNGLFVISANETNTLVASVGAVHNPNPGRYYFPFGGELGYLIVHPAHRRRGLGSLVSAL